MTESKDNARQNTEDMREALLKRGQDKQLHDQNKRPAKQVQHEGEKNDATVVQTGLAALRKLLDAIVQMIFNIFRRLWAMVRRREVVLKSKDGQNESELEEDKEKAKFMDELKEKLEQSKKSTLEKFSGLHAANDEAFRMQASALGATAAAQQLSRLSDKELADKVAAKIKEGAPADSLLELTKDLIGEENINNPAVQEVLDAALNSLDNMDFYRIIERKLDASGWQANIVDVLADINEHVLSPANKSFWKAVEGEREQYKKAYQELLAESEQEDLSSKEALDYLSAKSIYDEKRIGLKGQIMQVIEKEMPDSDGLNEMIADLIVHDLPQVNISEITANNLIGADLYKNIIKHLCNNCYQDMFSYVAARDHFEQQYDSIDINKAAILNKVHEDCIDALCVTKDGIKEAKVIDFNTRQPRPRT